MFSVGVAETPVVVYVPEASVDRIDNCKGDEQGTVGRALVNAVYAKSHVEENGGGVFAQVEKMGKGVASVVESSETLDGAPYSR